MENKSSITPDLSYSGISDYIEGDEIKGADFLNVIAKRKEFVDAKIKELERELDSLKFEAIDLVHGAQLVLQHLKKETLLAVQRQGYIVVVSDKDITIERNVI